MTTAVWTSGIDPKTESIWMAACIYKVLTTWAEAQEHTLEHKKRLCEACDVSNMLHLTSGLLWKKGGPCRETSCQVGTKQCKTLKPKVKRCLLLIHRLKSQVTLQETLHRGRFYLRLSIYLNIIYFLLLKNEKTFLWMKYYYTYSDK